MLWGDYTASLVAFATLKFDFVMKYVRLVQNPVVLCAGALRKTSIGSSKGQTHP